MHSYPSLQEVKEEFMTPVKNKIKPEHFLSKRSVFNEADRKRVNDAINAKLWKIWLPQIEGNNKELKLNYLLGRLKFD